MDQQIPDLNTVDNINSIKSYLGDDINKINCNPINFLQEKCIARGWPLPFYETATEEEEHQNELFTIACNTLIYREMGKGTTKKIAKLRAAHRMLRRLQKAPINAVELIGVYGWIIDF